MALAKRNTEYWIVDPEKNRITVYNFDEENGDEYSFDGVVPCGIYGDLAINFKELQIK